MEDKKLIELKSDNQTTQKIYQCGNNIYKVRREFATDGSSVLEQTVSMLLDIMEKKKENKL